MRHSELRGRKLPKRTISWHEAEYAALKINAANTCDDRVSEEIFDVEDEHAEVDIIVHGLMHGMN